MKYLLKRNKIFILQNLQNRGFNGGNGLDGWIRYLSSNNIEKYIIWYESVYVVVPLYCTLVNFYFTNIFRNNGFMINCFGELVCFTLSRILNCRKKIIGRNINQG